MGYKHWLRISPLNQRLYHLDTFTQILTFDTTSKSISVLLLLLFTSFFSYEKGRGLFPSGGRISVRFRLCFLRFHRPSSYFFQLPTPISCSLSPLSPPGLFPTSWLNGRCFVFSHRQRLHKVEYTQMPLWKTLLSFYTSDFPFHRHLCEEQRTSMRQILSTWIKPFKSWNFIQCFYPSS